MPTSQRGSDDAEREVLRQTEVVHGRPPEQLERPTTALHGLRAAVPGAAVLWAVIIGLGRRLRRS